MDWLTTSKRQELDEVSLVLSHHQHYSVVLTLDIDQFYTTLTLTDKLFLLMLSSICSCNFRYKRHCSSIYLPSYFVIDNSIYSLTYSAQLNNEWSLTVQSQSTDCSKIWLQSRSMISRFVLGHSGAAYVAVTDFQCHPSRQYGCICLAFRTVHYAWLNY